MRRHLPILHLLMGCIRSRAGSHQEMRDDEVQDDRCRPCKVASVHLPGSGEGVRGTWMLWPNRMLTDSMPAETKLPRPRAVRYFCRCQQVDYVSILSTTVVSPVTVLHVTSSQPTSPQVCAIANI